MTAPSTARQDWLRNQHRRITATKAALDGARAAHEHSPNPETRRVMERVERELDRLIDALPRDAAVTEQQPVMPDGRMV